jgi:chromosome segregation ATPase
VVNLKSQIQVYDEKIFQMSQEMSSKDEHLLIARMEIQSANEKLKTKTEEIIKYEQDLENLSQKCVFLTEETRKLEASLDKSRDNGERLHKESEMVIANVNSWVHEQRYFIFFYSSIS